MGDEIGMPTTQNVFNALKATQTVRNISVPFAECDVPQIQVTGNMLHPYVLWATSAREHYGHRLNYGWKFPQLKQQRRWVDLCILYGTH